VKEALRPVSALSALFLGFLLSQRGNEVDMGADLAFLYVLVLGYRFVDNI